MHKSTIQFGKQSHKMSNISDIRVFQLHPWTIMLIIFQPQISADAKFVFSIIQFLIIGSVKIVCMQQQCSCSLIYNIRADTRLPPSQWETSSQCNTMSHWLGANLESALYSVLWFIVLFATKCRIGITTFKKNYIPLSIFFGDNKRTTRIKMSNFSHFILNMSNKSASH